MFNFPIFVIIFCAAFLFLKVQVERRDDKHRAVVAALRDGKLDQFLAMSSSSSLDIYTAVATGGGGGELGVTTPLLC